MNCNCSKRSNKLACKVIWITPTWHAEALYEQARNSMERNRYEEASNLLNQSIALFQTLDQRKRLADAYRQLGLTYRYQSRYSTALEYIYLAMQIYQELGDKSAISSTYNSIGTVMEKMGQLEEASQAHNQALQLHYELDDQQGIASALYNIGDIYRSMGDFEKALPYLQDALKMDIAAGEPKNIAYSLNKLGYMLNQMGQREQGRDYLYQALALFEDIQAPRDTDWAWSAIAQLELDDGNIDLASDIINGVISRATENNYNSLLVDAHLVAAKIAIRRKQFEQALSVIEQGIAQAIANDEVNKQATLEALRVDVLYASNAVEAAFNALKRQKALDDSILDAQRIDTIARMQAESDFVMQAQRIKLLENETALQQAVIEKEQLSLRLWVISVIAISVFVVLFIGRLNQRKLNRELSQQVQARTHELQTKNGELSKAYKRMEALSMSDKLTGINNRRFLEKYIDSDMVQTIRKYEDWQQGRTAKPKESDIAFFMFDLDNFKKINDQYGHTTGDEVLIEFVSRMKNVFRQSDYLIRWGGEEFVAVARFIDASSAPVLAQRMLHEVSAYPFDVPSSKPLSLTCSIGYCCFSGAHEQQNTSWYNSIAVADACSYIVKYSGKNGWFGIESMNQTLDLSAQVTPEKLGQWYAEEDIVVKTDFEPQQLKWSASRA
ncbi:tetratricopeptide repeat-containing diguanylate cyclase [Alteromonas oceanisediminis]|uniref:tetratricopeptide repeat-containing diguanylate cyclase n=1 Tax=Alteromonas oceanisediminis TaxID=2836180 RepID=UPI001BD96A32|nr:tetratricopeptide repeat-containing diguanylate cyclase [Alteromonas oceanisediminis]MBT0585256.1 GGDEF domain-containing protein [Alteromonas oceanisediminis]